MWIFSRNSRSAIARCASGLAALCLLPAPTRAATEEADAAYLLALQDPSGCWTSAAPERTTGAALCALAGLPAEPARDRAIARGLDWLIAHQAPDGRWGPPDLLSAAVDHGLALWACADCAKGQTDKAAGSALRNGMDHVLANQQPNGGWGDTLGMSAKPSRCATAILIKALTACRAAGSGGPKLESALRRASQHLRSYQDAHTYLLDSNVGTWDAIFAWLALGEGDAPFARRTAVTAARTESPWAGRVSEPLAEAMMSAAAAAAYPPWISSIWSVQLEHEWARRQLPHGGWPPSPSEPTYGAAYATAMCMLMQQAPARFGVAAAPAPVAGWRIGAEGRAWHLLAAVPIQPEDVALLSPAYADLLARASAVYQLTEPSELAPPAGAALPARALRQLLALNQDAVDGRWSMDENWRQLAYPTAQPARGLVTAGQVAAALAPAAGDLLAAVPEGAADHLPLLLGESRDLWRTGGFTQLGDLPLRRLPPAAAAAWIRLRHDAVNLLARQLQDTGGLPPGAVLFLPFWYAAGDGGLADELRGRGFDVAPLGPHSDLSSARESASLGASR